MISKVERGDTMWFIPLDQNAIRKGVAMKSKKNGPTEQNLIALQISHHKSVIIEAIDIYSTRKAAVSALRAVIKAEIANLRSFDKVLELEETHPNSTNCEIERPVKKHRLRFSYSIFDSGGI